MFGDDLMPSRAVAVADFNRLRRQAAMRDLLARLRGESSELLSYEEVREKLKGLETSQRKLEDIPLAAIVGSAGRYREFTRDFLPGKAISADRWARVKLAMTGLSGVPPIEVYRIGQAYFVQDGNHRVSVARQLGLKTLQAYVIEVRTLVPLTPDVRPCDLILAAEQTEFLERTHIERLLPEADLRLTAAGHYPVLLEHIDVHRYFMGLEQQRDISRDEAVVHWHRTVYQPLAQMIRERNLLRDFPHRTETDMYLWLCRHRAELEEALGWEISMTTAASDLAHQHRPLPNPAAERLRRVLTVDSTGSEPMPQPTPDNRPRTDRIVDDLLVAIDGQASGWDCLTLGLNIARRENARVHGLHLTATPVPPETERHAAIREEFERRCRDAGVIGKLVIETGVTVNRLCQRARWADIVVTPLTQLATEPDRTSLGAGFRSLLQHCPRPVLAVPCKASNRAFGTLERILLAFDGGAKSLEALSVAIYMAGWWSVALDIVIVDGDPDTVAELKDQLRERLDHYRIEAHFITDTGRIAPAILRTARDRNSDLILMGGYGPNAPFQWVLGRAVDGVLKKSFVPVLVCQ